MTLCSQWLCSQLYDWLYAGSWSTYVSVWIKISVPQNDSQLLILFSDVITWRKFIICVIVIGYETTAFKIKNFETPRSICVAFLSFKCTKSRNSDVSFRFVFARSIEASCEIEKEGKVRSEPTDDDPTTPEWSTSLLPTKVRCILEVWQYTAEQD